MSIEQTVLEIERRAIEAHQAGVDGVRLYFDLNRGHGIADFNTLLRLCNDLRAAIEKHRGQQGNDRCWLDDVELYSVLGDEKLDADTMVLPPKEEFLVNCTRFWECRQPKEGR